VSVKIIGIAGGSGSGKTYFAHELQKRLGPGLCSLILQDNYYIDQSVKFDHDGGAVNFDHPSSIDFSLMVNHLQDLRRMRSIKVPLYDFKTHTRSQQTQSVHPTPFILVDGILVLCQPELRTLMDESVFIDTTESLRLQRRLRRDIEERGRTREGVHTQFFGQVKPMHDQFVEPTKAFASFVLTEDDHFQTKLEQIIVHLLG
jgi:uridine kinase